MLDEVDLLEVDPISWTLIEFRFFDLCTRCKKSSAKLS